MSCADRADELLPQTQCRRCGYDGCRPYAEAVADGRADINRCAPGGDATVAHLAQLMRRPAKPLDPEVGAALARSVAWIDPEQCIGCAKCLPSCPVDAIAGAHKFLHGVIAEQCTGCELCVAPCPVDCIHMVAAPDAHANDAMANRRRYQAHLERAKSRAELRSRELARQKEWVRTG